MWMAIIFAMSTGVGAPQSTSRFIVPILTWLIPDISPESLHAIRFMIRKVMHVIEYAILAGLVWRALFQPTAKDNRKWSWPVAGKAFAITVVYAATDEWHQSFVPHRVGSIFDVGFDGFGAAIAVVALWCFRQTRNRSTPAADD